MSNESRAVEHSILERRFEAALVMAADLEHEYPDDPLVAHHQATIFRGLDRPADEAGAWERFMTLSSEAVAACPWVVDAYERAGARDQASHALRRCRELDHPGAARPGDLHD